MKKSMRSILSRLLIVTLFVGIVCVVNVDTTYAASKKIHLKKTTISVVAGKTYQQKLIDKKGKTIKATKVKWKSLKPSVAKINKKGKITAVKAGTAKMTAKYKGKTYKFTVKVKKKPTPAPTHNTSIRVEPTSLTLLVGDSQTVTVKTDKGYNVAYNNSNGNVSSEWGNWSSYYDVNLTITGRKEGTAVVEVYDAADHSVKTQINVTVLSYYQYLRYYINEYGYVNGNGDKTFHYSISDQNDVYFVDHDYSIELVNVMTTESTQFYTSMPIYKSGGNITTANVIIGSYDMHSNVFIDSYTKSTKLSFITDEGEKPIEQVQNLANSALRSAMSSWNLALLYNMFMDLKDLGFINY